MRAPQTATVNVAVRIQPKAGVTFDAAKAAVQTALAAQFTGAMLGRSVYRAALGNLIYETGAVENYTLVQPAADVAGAAGKLPVLGTVTVTEDA